MDLDVKRQIAEQLGTLIMANYIAIGSMILGAGKLIWHLSKADSRITEAKEAAVRAHKRIDKLEGVK